MLLKPLPIGVDDFKNLITNHYYYVDKSWMIKELLDLKGEVNLFTRPRRFGKTLNMSMLRYFFENHNKEKNALLFDNLKILKADASYLELMGAYPVITLSFKAGKQTTFEESLEGVLRSIAAEYRRHWEYFPGHFEFAQKERYQRIMNETGSYRDALDSIALLSEVLYRFYQKKVIILLDEYDVPLENAYFQGFYIEMTAFIRSLLESALKGNPNLEFAVITGCLRITKESIFTGLNNLKINSILNAAYSEHFGFLQKEVDAMLTYYDKADKRSVAKEWYNGYRFGNDEVYNPWSVINYIDALRADAMALPVPYWANTSSNHIVRVLIERADLSLKGELEQLIAGKSIEKPVFEEITYEDIEKTTEHLWNFLLFTGYLKKVSIRLEGLDRYMSMEIPNNEVKYIYKNTILSWIDENLKQTDLSELYQSLRDGDTVRFSILVSEQLSNTISFYDYKENFYHGFLAGLLQGLPGYRILSNRESGTGRPDLILKTPSVRGEALILELKAADSLNDMEHACDRALQQIKDRNYIQTLQQEGYQKIRIYGIAFYQKECLLEGE